MNCFTVHLAYLCLEAFSKKVFSKNDFEKFLVDTFGFIDKRAVRSSIGYLKLKGFLQDQEGMYSTTSLFYDFSDKTAYERIDFSLLDVMIKFMADDNVPVDKDEFCAKFLVTDETEKLSLFTLRDELFQLDMLKIDEHNRISLSMDGLAFFKNRCGNTTEKIMKPPLKKNKLSTSTPVKTGEFSASEFVAALQAPFDNTNLLGHLKNTLTQNKPALQSTNDSLDSSTPPPANQTEGEPKNTGNTTPPTNEELSDPV